MTQFRGNLAADFLIPKEVDLSVFWIELRRDVFDPANKKMITEKRISCFDVGEFRKQAQTYARLGRPDNQWIIDAGWHSMIVLHDPTLPSNDADKLKIK